MQEENIVSILVIALSIVVVFVLIKAIIERYKRHRFRKENRENQYSGSAVRGDNKGLLNASRRNVKYKSRAESLGESGERRVTSYLEDLPHQDYQVFNDILIRKGGYTTQIDHIIISRFGIFVIETKNIHGKVYGSYNSEFWKQYLPDTGYKRYGFTQEHKLRNPLWQNAGHIKSLRKLVFGDDVPVHGIVAFPNDTELYVDCERQLRRMGDIVHYIGLFEDNELTDERMDYYRRRLLEVMSTSEDDRLYHLENVHENKARRDAAVASGKCPLCGSALVLRKGPYGSFYGCSGYPNCKYKLPRDT